MAFRSESLGSFGRGPGRIGARLDAAELVDVLDQRTRELIGRGRKARRGWLVRRGLAVADVTGLSLAFVAVMLAYGSTDAEGHVGVAGELALFAIMLPVWVVLAKLHGLYERDEESLDHSTADDIVGVFHLVTIGAWVLLVGSRATNVAHPGVVKIAAFWALAVIVVPLMRAAVRRLCRRSASFVQNTVIVGAGDVGQLVARKLVRHPEYGINVVGFVDGLPRDRHSDLPEHLTILGGPNDLRDIIEQLAVERVIVSFSNEPGDRTVKLVRSLNDLNVQVDLVPNLFELVGPRVGVHTVEGLPLVGLPPVRPSRSSRMIKRAIDAVCAGLMLLATLPLFAFVAWRIHRDSPGPIFFRQRRLGCGMKEFTALKFRTMRVDTDDSLHREYIGRTMSAQAESEASGMYKLDRGNAVTPFGRFLRRTSLDELPQLINVLRGEMSLVGPRPCIDYEIEHFETHHFDRFLVPQGLTGLWQVTARANSTFGEALDMDVAYVRGWSLWLDLRLMLRTPAQMLRQRRSTA